MNENKNPLTPTQARKLAEFISLIRPTWDPPGIYKFVGEATTLGMGDAYETAIAAIRAAQATTNLAPSVIKMPGNHWHVEEKFQTALQQLRTTEEKLRTAEQRLAGTYAGERPDTNDPPCPDHPGQHLSTCKPCATTKTPMPADFRTRAGLPPKSARKPTRRRKTLEPTTTHETPSERPTP